MVRDGTCNGTGGMKAAFACWQDRIAPLFDTARLAWTVEATAGAITGREEIHLTPGLPLHGIQQLAERQVEVLVCGAISRSLQDLVASYGIDLVPFVAGELDEIIEAWLRGGLQRGAFAMPGCCGRRRRRQRERKVRRCQAEIVRDPWEGER